jgi:circadian clock protein KaiB
MTDRATLSTETAAMRAAMAAQASAPYLMRLYVTGATPHSVRAIINIRKICEEHLGGRYELEVVDIAQNPEMAAGGQIVAAPTLIRLSPLPERRFVGDMSQTGRLLVGLELWPRGAPASPATSL